MLRLTGTVHLEFNADHAVSFQVWHEGPGDPASIKFTNVLLSGEYNATGISAGPHEQGRLPVEVVAEILWAFSIRTA